MYIYTQYDQHNTNSHTNDIPTSHRQVRRSPCRKFPLAPARVSNINALPSAVHCCLPGHT